MNTPFCGYTLLREIRRGGMGIVWLAEDGDGQQVAVKVLLEKYRHNAEVRSRFEVEPEHQLAHANIPRVIEADECNGLPYFAMELVEGESLEDKLSSPTHRMSWVELHPILSQIASALDHIHGQGLVHRDVKPDNILIRAKDNKAYLIDFGIAKQAGRVALTGTDHEPFGTYAYMAPEQCQKPVRSLPASDIYALAVTAYQALCGALPYQAATDDELKRMHLRSPLPDICRANPDIPRQASAVLQQALAKDPERRFHSASDFVASLNRAMLGVVSPATSHPKVFGALTALFAMAAIALGIAAGFLSGVIKLPVAQTALPSSNVVAVATPMSPSASSVPAVATASITQTGTPAPADVTAIPTLAQQATDKPTRTPTPAPTETATATPKPILTRNATADSASNSPVQVVGIVAGGQRWYQPEGWPSPNACRVLKVGNTKTKPGVYFNFSLQAKNTSSKPVALGPAELTLNQNRFPFACTVEGNPAQVQPAVGSDTLPRITIGVWVENLSVNDEIGIRFGGLPNKRFCARLTGFSGDNAVFTPVVAC